MSKYNGNPIPTVRKWHVRDELNLIRATCSNREEALRVQTVLQNNTLRPHRVVATMVTKAN